MFKFIKNLFKGNEEKLVGGKVSINPSSNKQYSRNMVRIRHIEATLERMAKDNPRRKGFELELKRRSLALEYENFKKTQEAN